MYLYHAFNSVGNMIDFYLNKSRNHKIVKRFISLKGQLILRDKSVQNEMEFIHQLIRMAA